tara:strand:- start:279 stop:1430 length:1152 start_codon:yes stop_codon:yes gene_type:complete
MTKVNKQQVVIVGGGFVGCLAAIMLAKLNINSTIIEAKPANNSTSHDPRGIALNYASCQLLNTLNFWPTLSKTAMPIKTVHVSTRGAFSKVRFYAKDRGLDYLACVIEGQHLLNTLVEHTQQNELIQWRQPETVKTIKQTKNNIEVTLESGESLSAQLLLAADGQRSFCRKLLGIQAVDKTTEHALLTNITLQPSHPHTAYERFTPEGTIALLPLTSNQYKLVITGSKQQINDWQSLPEEHFLDKLQHSFGLFAGKFSAISQRIHYPLTEMRTSQQTQTRAILLGNAAHALHPIAAQGLNLAIRDLTQLIDLLSGAIRSHQDIGNNVLLAGYEKAVKTSQSTIIKLTNVLSKLQGRLLSRSALALVANCPIIQSVIETQALGI